MSNTENLAKFSAIPRNDGGRFAAGGPGRLPGTRNRISNEALQAVREMKDGAIQQLQEKLAAGDWQALVFVLERVLPRGRTVELPDASPAEIKAALISGQITTDEAKNIAVALEKLANVDDLEEIKAKIAELEKAINDGKG